MIEEKKIDSPVLGIASRLARKNILNLSPYRCARDDYDTGILLDANENPLGPPISSSPAQNNDLVLERYPCPYQTTLKELYAEYRGHGVRTSQIFVGVGSDEAIDLLMRVFCVPGTDSIMITPPTYGMYGVSAIVNDAGIVKVPLTEDFDLRIEEMLDAANDNIKLMFLCSPGNPTAKAIPLEDIERVASDERYRGLVVVDEAYVDFSDRGTALSLLHRYPNIVVLQTLSKAFGLAGIRMGFCLAHDDVIQLMNNVKAPYNINKLSSEVAVQAMHNTEVAERNVQILIQNRALLATRLNELDYVTKVYPSDTNFILFRLKRHALKIYKTMADRGVVSRYRGSETHCSECIRITVGTVEEIAQFLKLMDAAWKEFAL